MKKLFMGMISVTHKNSKKIGPSKLKKKPSKKTFKTHKYGVTSLESGSPLEALLKTRMVALPLRAC